MGLQYNKKELVKLNFQNITFYPGSKFMFIVKTLYIMLTNCIRFYAGKSKVVRLLTILSQFVRD